MAARPGPGIPGGGLARHEHALAPRRVREASVVSVITNQADEGRFLDVDDVHVAPALDGIIHGLEMLLGSNIFTAEDEPVGPVSKIEKPAKLARIYKGSTEKIANRTQDDRSEATHRFSGKTILA